MGTSHTMIQHLNLLNREPGLNCFTLPGNQGALQFSTGWRRRGKRNQASDTSVLSRCPHSPVSKDAKDMKSTSTYLLLLLEFYVFLVWPNYLSFGFILGILIDKICYDVHENFRFKFSVSWSVFKVGKGDLKQDKIAKTSLRLVISWNGFSFFRPMSENLQQQYLKFQNSQLHHGHIDSQQMSV